MYRAPAGRKGEDVGLPDRRPERFLAPLGMTGWVCGARVGHSDPARSFRRCHTAQKNKIAIIMVRIANQGISRYLIGSSRDLLFH